MSTLLSQMQIDAIGLSNENGFWTFMGAQPHVQPVLGKGRYLTRALDAGHYYCQAPKIGSVHVATNYVAYRDFTVELQTILNLWRRHKVENSVKKSELMTARGRGTRNYLTEIQHHEAWQQARRDAAVKALLETWMPWKPSRIVPAVAAVYACSILSCKFFLAFAMVALVLNSA